MSTNANILVIDDEVQIRKLLQITLTINGYKVSEASTAKEGIISASTYSPALIFLDLGLPDEDGLSVLRKLREWFQNPIIILSVRNSEMDVITALDNGANDYITKPFRTGELLARLRTSLRISQNQSSTSSKLSFGSLSIDFTSHVVRKNDYPIKLTSTEYSLLALMTKNCGKVLTHQFILTEIWGQIYSDQTQYLRVFIAQLRKKVEDDPAHPSLIITESGIGYRFFE